MSTELSRLPRNTRWKSQIIQLLTAKNCIQSRADSYRSSRNTDVTNLVSSNPLKHPDQILHYVNPSSTRVIYEVLAFRSTACVCLLFL
jgi:hypothetical protein